MGHGVFQSVASFVAACSKHVAKASKKLLVPSGNSGGGSGKVKMNGAEQSYLEGLYPYSDNHQPIKLPRPSPLKTPPRSPLHQILSHKTTSFVSFLGNNKEGKKEEEENGYYDDYWEDDSDVDEERAPHEGNDGVWRKNILMGEKCEPLDFSGVIYYDNDGRRVDRDGKQQSKEVDGGGRDGSYQQVGGNPSSAAYRDLTQPPKLPLPPLKSQACSTPRIPPPRSPLHQMLSRKASFVPFLGKKKKQKEEEEEERYYDAWEDESDADVDAMTTPRGEDDGGVWRKNILMGEKCEPLDFSGVIYYDSDGRRLDRVPPRSPRHPMAGGDDPFPSFSFPVIVETAQDGHFY